MSEIDNLFMKINNSKLDIWAISLTKHPHNILYRASVELREHKQFSVEHDDPIMAMRLLLEEVYRLEDIETDLKVALNKKTEFLKSKG